MKRRRKEPLMDANEREARNQKEIISVYSCSFGVDSRGGE